MISDAQLRELLAQKSETKNVDCKESFNWDAASNEAKCELAKDILAFMNTQDGGVIVFGVRDSTSSDAAIHVSLEMTGVQGRILVAAGHDVPPLFPVPTSRIPDLKIEEDYTVSELRASAEELAIKTVQRIFEMFNWNSPDAGMIRGWQQRLLSRTF